VLTDPGIKALSYPPAKGEYYLSVNLAGLDPAKVWEVSRSLGFEPELVQISSRGGESLEIHALLLHEQKSGEPILTSDLDVKIDQLADRINPDAIRHVYGGRILA
jgi:hypothetical protein